MVEEARQGADSPDASAWWIIYPRKWKPLFLTHTGQGGSRHPPPPTPHPATPPTHTHTHTHTLMRRARLSQKFCFRRPNPHVWYFFNPFHFSDLVRVLSYTLSEASRMGTLTHTSQMKKSKLAEADSSRISQGVRTLSQAIVGWCDNPHWVHSFHPSLSPSSNPRPFTNELCSVSGNG